MATPFFEGFTLDTLLGVVGVVLGVVAALLAWWGLRVAIGERKVIENEVKPTVQASEAALDRANESLAETRNALSTAVDDVRNQITTRYLSAFPDFMPEIVDTLEQADEWIKIFCDQPAYGVISRSDTYRAYVAVLRRKHEENVRIEMVHLDKADRIRLHHVQFGGERWEETHANPRLAQFVADHPPENGSTFAEMKEDDFVAFVEELQAKALGEDFTFAEEHRYPTSQIMPLYFWITNRSHAVFAVTEFDSDDHEAGFATESQALKKALSSVFDRYRQDALANPPPAPPVLRPTKVARLVSRLLGVRPA